MCGSFCVFAIDIMHQIETLTENRSLISLANMHLSCSSKTIKCQSISILCGKFTTQQYRKKETINDGMWTRLRAYCKNENMNGDDECMNNTSSYYSTGYAAGWLGCGQDMLACSFSWWHFFIRKLYINRWNWFQGENIYTNTLYTYFIRILYTIFFGIIILLAHFYYHYVIDILLCLHPMLKLREIIIVEEKGTKLCLVIIKDSVDNETQED